MSTADLSPPLHELQRHRCTQFDAEIVDALLQQARAAQTAA
jgi:HD-GYP domain-containing protein (c-di-GMP phosphodiesterase class II)